MRRTGVAVLLFVAAAVAVDARQERSAAADTSVLTERSLANVVAFARLLGYVRHFHPSDEAASTDWNAFAVEGMRMVERAATIEALRQQLDTLFRPIAPSVDIFLVSARPVLRPAALAAGPQQRLLAWRHLGFGGGESKSEYRSERVATATPPATLEVQLGGGVAARVPLAVAADSRGTLPRGQRPPARTTTASGGSRAARLAGIALAWNVLQHFYPYFDVVRTDWPAVLPLALARAATDATDLEFTDTLNRLASGLRDGQASATSAAWERAQFTPPVAIDSVEGRVLVTDADPATGLLRGDAIVAVNGTPAPLALEDIERTVSGATPQWLRVRGLQQLLWGTRDSEVRLRIDRLQSPGQRDITLRRTVADYRPPQPIEPVADLQPGIVYIDLRRVTDAAFTAALPRMTAAKGIVFDLRGAAGPLNHDTLFGHLTRDTLTGPQWHVPEISRPDREALAFVRGPAWTLAPHPPYLPARKVFLADAHAIGTAESYLAIVAHYRLGEIVGAPTAGTSGAVNSVTLPGGFTMRFTGTKVLTHDGAQHHGIGVRPIAAVKRTRVAVANGRDEVLDRAVRALLAPEP